MIHDAGIFGSTVSIRIEGCVYGMRLYFNTLEITLPGNTAVLYSRAAQTVCVKFPPYVVKLLLNYLHENNKKIAELLLLDICDHLSIVQQIAGFWIVVFISVSFTLSLNKRWMFTIV